MQNSKQTSVAYQKFAHNSLDGKTTTSLFNFTCKDAKDAEGPVRFGLGNLHVTKEQRAQNLV